MGDEVDVEALKKQVEELQQQLEEANQAKAAAEERATKAEESLAAAEAKVAELQAKLDAQPAAGSGLFFHYSNPPLPMTFPLFAFFTSFFH